MIYKLQSGDKVQLRKQYRDWLKLSPTLKLKRNFNIASNFIKNGPSIGNFGNAISALFGGYNPENPDLITGDVPAAGIKNFGKVVKTARVARELNNVVSKGLKSGTSKTLETTLYSGGERPILIGNPYIRWSQEGYLNEARDVYPKGDPNQFFLIVKDVEDPIKGKLQTQGNGQYSLHFKTDRNKFRGNEKENMFKVVESLIPEGGVVSTWGHVSPGGYHAINRFGNLFGYSKIGERPGVNGPIPIYEKITKPYSGYTPTKQNPAYSKFVQDVMEGFGWGMHRKLRPSKLQDLTSYIEGKERLGYGAENSVYEGPEGMVLKALNGPNPFGKLEVAMKEGQQYVDRFNSRPYNIPISLEGYTRRAGGYLPVYGQLKVSTNIGDILEKMPKLEKSLNGQYMYYGKPNPNRILLENGIDKALDFKPANLGILPDGTLMGIDLFKKGGKL